MTISHTILLRAFFQGDPVLTGLPCDVRGVLETHCTACHAGQTRVSLTQGEFRKDPSMLKALRWRTPVIVKSLPKWD